MALLTELLCKAVGERFGVSGRRARNALFPMLAMNYRGPLRVRIDHKPMPDHPAPAGRDRAGDADLHLRLRPPPLSSARCPTAASGTTFGHEFTGVVEQVGPGSGESRGRRPRAGAVQHRLRPVPVLPAGACSATATKPTRWRRRWGASSATRTRRAATMAARPNTSACPTPTSGLRSHPGVDGPRRTPSCSPTLSPTGYQAAEMGGIQRGDTVVVFGAGPVGHDGGASRPGCSAPGG